MAQQNIERVVFVERNTFSVDFRLPNFPHTWVDYPTTEPGKVVERLRNATIAVCNKWASRYGSREHKLLRKIQLRIENDGSQIYETNAQLFQKACEPSGNDRAGDWLSQPLPLSREHPRNPVYGSGNHEKHLEHRGFTDSNSLRRIIAPSGQLLCWAFGVLLELLEIETAHRMSKKME